MVTEQKQRVVADGLDAPGIGGPFLRPMHRALARIHVEQDHSRRESPSGPSTRTDRFTALIPSRFSAWWQELGQATQWKVEVSRRTAVTNALSDPM